MKVLNTINKYNVYTLLYFSLLWLDLRSIEQLSHVLDEIVVQPQILHFLVQLPQFFLRCQQSLHSLLQSIILNNQVSDVLLLSCQNALQMFDVLFSACQLLLKILFHAHLVVSHHYPQFALLVLDGSTRFQLQSFDVSFFQSQLTCQWSVLSGQMFDLFLQFDVLILDFFVFVIQLFYQLLLLLILWFGVAFDFFLSPFHFIFELSLQTHNTIFWYLDQLSQLLLFVSQLQQFVFVQLFHFLHGLQQICDFFIFGITQRMELLLLLLEKCLRFVFLIGLSDQSLRGQFHLSGQTRHLLFVF